MCKCRSHGTFPLFGLQSSHLNICYYHQDLHRRPLRPGSRPRFCSDRRALLLIGAWHLPRRPGIGRALKRHPFSGLVDSADERFARQYRCGPPPEFPLASPRSGIVHHLSGPDRHALTRTLLRRSRSVGGATLKGIPPVSFLTPYGFNRPLTRTHVRLLGPCFKTGRMGSPQADARSTQMPRHAETARAAYHDRVDGVSAGISTARALAAAAIRIGQRPEPIGGPACDRSTSDRGASPAPIRFPPDNFKHSLTLFSKSFSSFPRGYLFAIGLSPVFSLGQNLPPDWGCIPKQPDSPTAPRGATGSGHNGALTLSGATFQWTWARSAAEDASPDYNSDAMGARFSSWAIPGSLAVTRGILSRNRARHFFEPSMRDRPHTTGNRGFATNDCRGVRRRGLGIYAQPRDERTGGHHRPPNPEGVDGGATTCDAQAGVPSGLMASGGNLRSKTRCSLDSAIHTQVSHCR
ncbi:hypothetical protein GBA52_018102 [Prunus armeniaca]|nr:hypothetical protein GBA52_018102 [Prunus armeniaca]